MHKRFWVSLVIGLALILSACGGSSSNDTEGEPTQAAAGEKIFNDMGCKGCHDVETIAPPLAGVYNSDVTLETGETVTADEAYLRESILEPDAKVVAGFQPVMPDFEQQLTDEDVSLLIEYIKALK